MSKQYIQSDNQPRSMNNSQLLLAVMYELNNLNDNDPEQVYEFCNLLNMWQSSFSSQDGQYMGGDELIETLVKALNEHYQMSSINNKYEFMQLSKKLNIVMNKLIGNEIGFPADVDQKRGEFFATIMNISYSMSTVANKNANFEISTRLQTVIDHLLNERQKIVNKDLALSEKVLLDQERKNILPESVVLDTALNNIVKLKNEFDEKISHDDADHVGLTGERERVTNQAESILRNADRDIAHSDSLKYCIEKMIKLVTSPIEHISSALFSLSNSQSNESPLSKDMGLRKSRQILRGAARSLSAEEKENCHFATMQRR